jgi:hypothetical protein
VRWTDEEFRRLRRLADPDLDEAVAGYRHAHPDISDALGLVKAMIRELAEAEERARGYGRADDEDGADVVDSGDDSLILLDELAARTVPPEWARDDSLLERGQAVFTDHGLYQAVALFFVSLPMGYALVPSAEVLFAISDLTDRDDKLTRRVAETGQMLIDVMGLDGPGSLAPGGAGYTTAIGVRVLHSFVRALMLDRPRGAAWDVAAHGPPANQELLLATLFDFSVVIWQAMDRMGVALSAEDRAANLYTWSVFGHLMGLVTCRDRALTLDDVDPVCVHFGRRLESSAAGRELMRALLREMEEFMPLGWRKLPRTLIRWLFLHAPHGVDRVPDLLEVPRAAWWSTPLFTTARLAQRLQWVPDPLRPAVRGLVRKAGRVVIRTYADRYSNGQAPFRVPGELARAWRIRQSPLAQRSRKARRRARLAVRAPLRPLRPGTEARNA